MQIHPGHFVAIFGGAVSGSEAAFQLSRRGIYCAVFEQNALPYGKIEDGLPKWHIKLRDQEEAKIDSKLNNPYVFYVPLTKLSREISIGQVAREWNFNAILLAIGAWRDRPLPVEGIDEYVNKGLYYQNPFVAWFNHSHEPDYQGQQFEIRDGTIVIGGGLASLDVVKIVMLELVNRELNKRGIRTNIFQLEKEGINKALDAQGLTLKDLGLKGCTLYYRRRIIDMPISPDAPAGSPPERIEKVHQVRKKIMNNFQTKYLFEFHERHVPVDKIIEGDRLTGLIFQQTEVVGGKARPIPGSELKIRAPLVISSIGSIPEPIPRLSRGGEVFQFEDPQVGKIAGWPNVFALGNAVTGRGNIKESLKHGRMVTEYVMENFLNWRMEDYQTLQNLDNRQFEIFSEEKHLLSKDKIEAIVRKIEKLQQAVGYEGNYTQWIETHRPKRMEEILEENQS